MPAVLLTFPMFRPLNANGTGVLPGGKLYAYRSGTTTPQSTFNESNFPNAHPTILDSQGIAHIRLTPNLAYRLDLFDAGDVHQAHWPIDNIIEGATHAIASTTVGCTLGAASIVAAGLIQPGWDVLLVTTRVAFGFSSTLGLTTFVVGDGISIDRWGEQTTPQFPGSLTGGIDAPVSNQARDATIARYNQVTPVIITAMGGLFDGTGTLDIAVHYLAISHAMA